MVNDDAINGNGSDDYIQSSEDDYIQSSEDGDAAMDHLIDAVLIIKSMYGPLTGSDRERGVHCYYK